MLKTLPAIVESNYSKALKANGYALHEAVVCQTKERKKLECLSRYAARVALSEPRLSSNLQG